jgi:hypothetical protein
MDAKQKRTYKVMDWEQKKAYEALTDKEQKEFKRKEKNSRRKIVRDKLKAEERVKYAAYQAQVEMCGKDECAGNVQQIMKLIGALEVDDRKNVIREISIRDQNNSFPTSIRENVHHQAGEKAESSISILAGSHLLHTLFHDSF